MPLGKRRRIYGKPKKTQATKLRQITRQLGAVEKKYQQYSNHNATDGTTVNLVGAGLVFQFNEIIQGNGAINRDGNKVQVTHFKYRARFSSTNNGPAKIRFIAFYWKSDTAPNLADVLNQPAAGSGICNPILNFATPLRVANKNLVVLKDQLLIIEGDTIQNSTRLASINFKRTFKVPKAQYYDDAGGGDMKQGLYYLVVSDVPDVFCEDNAITWFKDL